MPSTNQDIWKLLDSDISVQKNLNRGIINIRGLAKFLMKKYNLDTTLDSVISAIRRYESDKEFEEGEVSSVFKGARVTTKNGMVCLTLSLDAYKNIKKIMEHNHTPNQKYKVITGPNKLKVICDSNNGDDILPLVPKNCVIHREKKLSEISIMLSKTAIETKGVLARIVNEISINHINIAELIVCPPDVLVYVREPDLVKTHETLIRLCEE